MLIDPLRLQAHVSAHGGPGHRRGASASGGQLAAAEQQVCAAADVQPVRGGEEEPGPRPDRQAEEGHQGGQR